MYLLPRRRHGCDRQTQQHRALHPEGAVESNLSMRHRFRKSRALGTWELPIAKKKNLPGRCMKNHPDRGRHGLGGIEFRPRNCLFVVVSKHQKSAFRGASDPPTSPPPFFLNPPPHPPTFAASRLMFQPCQTGTPSLFFFSLLLFQSLHTHAIQNLIRKPESSAFFVALPAFLTGPPTLNSSERPLLLQLRRRKIILGSRI